MRYLFKFLFSKRVELLVSISFFLILFNNQISALFVGLLTITVLFDKNHFKFKLSKNAYFTIAFFIYLIIRTLFDVNQKKGFDSIIRLLPILVLVLTLYNYNFNKSQVNFVTKSFIFINYMFYASAIIYGIFIYIVDTNNNIIKNVSYYQWLIPTKFEFHPPYWGLSIVLSMIIVLINRQIKNTEKYIFIGSSFLFLLFLSSRIALLVGLIIFFIYLIFNVKMPSNKKFFLVISTLITFFVLTIYSPYLSNKIKNNEGFSVRTNLWVSSIEAMKDNYLFGGSFSQCQIAIKSYYEKNYPSITNYDPHNQFVYFGVSIGFIGLLLFLLSIFLSKDYNMGVIMFLIVMILSFMTESVLTRQMGVIMYALFFNLISNKSFTNNLSKKYEKGLNT